MTKNRFLYKAMAGFVSAALMASMTITAGAWNEDPGESETTTAATTEATLPELGGNIWDTTTTTEVPDAVLDDDEVADEDDEDIDPEITEPEVTEEEIIEEPEETEAPATTTAAATAAPAPSNTAAPDSYQAVEPFEMYVPEVLNVRGGPGTDYDKLGQVYANNVISIIGMSGDWYVFNYYGADGYLLSSLLQEVPEAPAETTTTTASPETDTTLPPVEDENEGDAVIDDDESYIEDDDTPVTTEAPDVPEETTTKATPAVAGPVEGNDGTGNAGGFPPVILALICAVAAFVLIGVVPVLVHRSYHKKLYQY